MPKNNVTHAINRCTGVRNIQTEVLTKCMKIPDSVELEKEAQRSNCAYGPATELDMQFDDGSVLRNVNLATLLTKLFAVEKLAF